MRKTRRFDPCEAEGVGRKNGGEAEEKLSPLNITHGEVCLLKGRRGYTTRFPYFIFYGGTRVF